MLLDSKFVSVLFVRWCHKCNLIDWFVKRMNEWMNGSRIQQPVTCSVVEFWSWIVKTDMRPFVTEWVKVCPSFSVSTASQDHLHDVVVWRSLRSLVDLQNSISRREKNLLSSSSLREKKWRSVLLIMNMNPGGSSGGSFFNNLTSGVLNSTSRWTSSSNNNNNSSGSSAQNVQVMMQSSSSKSGVIAAGGGQSLADRMNAARYALAGQGLAQRVCKGSLVVRCCISLLILLLRH